MKIQFIFVLLFVWSALYSCIPTKKISLASIQQFEDGDFKDRITNLMKSYADIVDTQVENNQRECESAGIDYFELECEQIGLYQDDKSYLEEQNEKLKNEQQVLFNDKLAANNESISKFNEKLKIFNDIDAKIQKNGEVLIDKTRGIQKLLGQKSQELANLLQVKQDTQPETSKEIVDQLAKQQIDEQQLISDSLQFNSIENDIQVSIDNVKNILNYNNELDFLVNSYMKAINDEKQKADDFQKLLNYFNDVMYKRLNETDDIISNNTEILDGLSKKIDGCQKIDVIQRDKCELYIKYFSMKEQYSFLINGPQEEPLEYYPEDKLPPGSFDNKQDKKSSDGFQNYEDVQDRVDDMAEDISGNNIHSSETDKFKPNRYNQNQDFIPGAINPENNKDHNNQKAQPFDINPQENDVNKPKPNFIPGAINPENDKDHNNQKAQPSDNTPKENDENKPKPNFIPGAINPDLDLSSNDKPTFPKDQQNIPQPSQKDTESLENEQSFVQTYENIDPFQPVISTNSGGMSLVQKQINKIEQVQDKLTVQQLVQQKPSKNLRKQNQ